MTKEQIFELYGKVLKGDKLAKKEFVGLYMSKFPNRNWMDLSQNSLHIMYLHLYK